VILTHFAKHGNGSTPIPIPNVGSTSLPKLVQETLHIWWQTPWPLLIITVNLPHQAMESQSTAPPRSRSPPSLDNEPTLNACCRGKNVSSKKACQRHQTLDCFLMFFVLDHLTYQCWWSNSRFFDQIQTSNAVSNAGITVTETEGWHWTYHHLVAVLHFWT
jgi:hypothetical protein